MNTFFNLSNTIIEASKKAMNMIKPVLDEIDRTTEYNQQKLLKAYIDNGVSESHFAGSTGYGYDDRGREIIGKVFAQAMGCEDAIVQHNFVCGTHALTVALFGVLRPGDTMLSVTGLPYDTLRSTIGIDPKTDGTGTLKDFGINYDQVDLLDDGTVDYKGIEERITPDLKMVYIQRSRGYSLRPSLFVSDIEKIAKIAKRKAPNCIVMLDNCYGEFVEKTEPMQFGVDLCAGSLIKNPGGGIAPTGGYVCGKAKYVDLAARRLTTAGIGKEVGATLGQSRELFMGLFNAPHITGEALKTAVFASALYEILGYEVTPKYNEHRGDIIQAVVLGEEQKLIAFCQGMQKGAPVDSFVTPEPWDMPGYDNKVIMAAGAFTLGASIELSADAPLREPYAAWMQGSLNFHSGKMGIMLSAQSMLDKGVL